MARYRGILLDLFETCVLFDTRGLPRMTFEGREIPSTTPHVHPLLAEVAPEISLEAFHRALGEAWVSVRASAAEPHREISSPRRFERALEVLGYQGEDAPALAEALARTHTRLVCGAARLPDAHRDALGALGGAYKLALVSNFDYAPSCRGLLDRLDLGGHFQSVVISDEIGWRKPDRRPFDEALSALGIKAHEALYVGDSPASDIVGAAALGMDVAWINRRGRPLPEGIPEPTFDIPDLPALLPLIGRRASQETSMIQEINAPELKARLDSADPPILLDVRERFELAICKLPGAIHIPLAQLPDRVDEIQSEGRQVVVICHHGVRSLRGAHILYGAGFADPLSLRGGIEAWSQLVDPSVARY